MDMYDEIEHWKAFLRNPNHAKESKQRILEGLRKAAERRGVTIPGYNTPEFSEFIRS